MSPMRIVFAGTGDISLPTLEWLIAQSDIELLSVVCQPDMPVGRSQTLTPPATKRLAVEYGIPVRQPQKLRNDIGYFTSVGADLIVVMAYGQLLTKAILDSPRIACLNLHASILPRHRGASPVQAAIREGDTESGVTVMYMDQGLDTGDILLSNSFKLAPDETGGSLHDRLAKAAPAALADALKLLDQGNAPRIKQDADAATHCGKLSRGDGRIDWNLPATHIERLIRAYDPWPGTTTQCLAEDSPISSKLLKIFPPTTVDGASDRGGTPGTVVDADDSGLKIQTGEGLIQIHEVQLEGKKRMDSNAFLKGNRLPMGTRFGAIN